MLRPRARVGRSPVVRRRRGLVPALLALLLTLTGCGSADGEETDGPSKAALTCREKWRDLEADVEGRSSKTNPSDLAGRWTSIAATVDYYATSAQASDCGKTLETQEQAMEDVSAFGTKLAPYDMELRLEQVQADAEEYAAGPTPPKPRPSPKKKGTRKQKKQPPAPPTPAEVGQALKTLAAQAPVATKEQGAGWQQAAVIELDDTAAVAKSVKDLAFLSSESPAYRACSLALVQIKTAVNPATTR